MQQVAMEFERQVVDTIKALDYQVTMEPWARPDQLSLMDRISSWWSRPPTSPYVPDMLVAHGEKVVLVEAKPYPILLGPVIQARHFADYFEAPAIICVPDDAFPEIPESVHEWADLNNIGVCPIGEIGDKLKMVLHD